MRRFTTICPMLLLLATTAVAGCGGGGGTDTPTGVKPPSPPPPPAGTPNSVIVSTGSFTPNDLTTTAGSTVTWTWDTCSGGDVYGQGQLCVQHNVVFDDGANGSGTISEGSFSRSFATAGTYPYHCAIHGAAMSGRVIVQ